MKNMKFIMLLVFIVGTNFSLMSCRETTETEHEDMDDMEMQDEGMMEEDDMQMDHD
ncbi:hypothetical protein SAMN05444483_10169 [Salegentibacter echinorum]|uniref:Uncharacterized protein n=1 Tax=Salegentibacter echinorum TaxID=1073325 RepID=A0A1M5BKD5_SALEC|nr:hypothetical protein [Salegentibacter echinorum]SHF42845.1 hypothetical protein SAMN05444483_10169 [Salegentibacter echinorum]